MAAATPRLFWQNFADLGNATVTASSEQSSYPARWLRDQLRSKPWRKKVGWDITAWTNDTFEFTEGTDKRVAFLDPTNYSTGALTAAQLQTAIGNAGIDPMSLAPTAWWRADSLTGQLDGTGVSSWTDSSGNARTLSQATAANQPTFTLNAVNGRPGLYFDGTTDYMQSAAALSTMLSGGAGTIFVVFKPNESVGATNVLVSDSAATPNMQLYHTSTNLVAVHYDGTTDTASESGISLGTWMLGIWAHTSTAILSGLNDGDTADMTSTATGATSSLAGLFNVGNHSTNYFGGYVAEIIVFNSELSEENRRRVMAYLYQKYEATNTTTVPTWANTYTATYDANTKKFTVARATGSSALALPFSTGTFSTTSCHLDLGFTTADKTAATTYTGENAAYQSRAWVTFNLASALEVTAGIVINHSSDTSGTYVLQGGASSAQSRLAAATTQTLTGDSDLRMLTFTAATYRYWTLVISDVQNTLGYVEIGRVYIGAYFQPARGYAYGFEEAREELSELTFADAGASFYDEKPSRRAWRLGFQFVSDSNKTTFDSVFAYVRKGRNFFVSLDGTAYPTSRTYYVFMPAGARWVNTETATLQWNLDLVLSEAI